MTTSSHNTGKTFSNYNSDPNGGVKDAIFDKRSKGNMTENNYTITTQCQYRKKRSKKIKVKSTPPPLDIIMEDETVNSQSSGEHTPKTINTTDYDDDDTITTKSVLTNKKNQYLSITSNTISSTTSGFTLVKTGEIMAQFLHCGIFFNKKWQSCIYAHYLPSLFIFFSKKEDFDSYRTNPFLSVQDRMALIIFAVDFNTDGVQKRMSKTTTPPPPTTTNVALRGGNENDIEGDIDDNLKNRRKDWAMTYSVSRIKSKTHHFLNKGITS